MNPILLAVIIVSAIGLVAGIGLTVANKLMAVKKDEKAEAILKVLPGANCGACSFSGCSGYAAALATGKVKTNLCSVGGEAVAAEVCAILGMKPSAPGEKKTAAVMCRGTCSATEKRGDYRGMPSCKAAMLIYGGAGSCVFGCIGLGDCVKACEYGAIRVCDGAAAVDVDKCRACGKCVSECPKKIISLVSVTSRPTVLCSNSDNGAKTRKVCTNGCIGCRMCAKVCENDAITFDGGRAVIDRNKCIGCGKCEEACKMHCIVRI
ncbi:MAG TPA: RnfABCDGE type electron transport complex subunit B [Bacillota bacterium]|nr:RnfABCDGE type electron transport complex subunit B [Bacillota bacterium]